MWTRSVWTVLCVYGTVRWACQVVSVNLADNEVHTDGGKYLGRALKKNHSLTELNLRLNRLEDEVRKPSSKCLVVV
jgi:hypothetical protein